jgi:hypothetical protein
MFREKTVVNKHQQACKGSAGLLTALDWERCFKTSKAGHLLWSSQSILGENSNPEAKTHAISGLSISWPIPLSTSRYCNFSIWRQSWIENISIVLYMLF